MFETSLINCAKEMGVQLVLLVFKEFSKATKM